MCHFDCFCPKPNHLLTPVHICINVESSEILFPLLSNSVSSFKLRFLLLIAQLQVFLHPTPETYMYDVSSSKLNASCPC